MCNPPFYSSPEEAALAKSSSEKDLAPYAVSIAFYIYLIAPKSDSIHLGMYRS